MADEVQIGIKATGGDAAAAELRKPAAGASDLDRALDKAREAQGRLSDEIDRGGNATARYAAQTKLAIDAARQHGTATEAQRAELDRLENELDQNILKAREFANEMKDQRELIGGTDGVAESFGKGQSKLLAMRDAVGSALAAGLAFREAYQTTREVVDFLNESLGINIDKWIQESAAVKGAAEALAGYNETAAEAAEADKRYAEALERLLAVRKDLDPAEKAAAAERAQQAKDYDELIGKLDPVVAKERERAEVMADLGKWLESGAISQDQYAQAVGLLDEKATGARDSLNSLATEGVQPVADAAESAAPKLDVLASGLDRAATGAERLKSAQEAAAAATDKAADAAADQQQIQDRLRQLNSQTFLSPEEVQEQEDLNQRLFDARVKAREASDEAAAAAANEWNEQNRAREASEAATVARGAYTVATEECTDATIEAARSAGTLAVQVGVTKDGLTFYNEAAGLTAEQVQEIADSQDAVNEAFAASTGTYSEGSEALGELADEAAQAALAERAHADAVAASAAIAADHAAAMEDQGEAAGAAAVRVAKFGDELLVYNGISDATLMRANELRDATVAGEAAMAAASGTYSEGSEALGEMASETATAATAQSDLTTAQTAAVKPAEDLRSADEKHRDVLREVNEEYRTRIGLQKQAVEWLDKEREAIEKLAAAVAGAGGEGG